MALSVEEIQEHIDALIQRRDEKYEEMHETNKAFYSELTELNARLLIARQEMMKALRRRILEDTATSILNDEFVKLTQEPPLNRIKEHLNDK